MAKPMMILIAGPYRSGTGDDPARMAENLRRLEEAAWPIFQKGHVPMIGEWVALPVLAGAGGGRWGMRFMTRSCIRRRTGFWSIAMRFCACRGHRRARTMT